MSIIVNNCRIKYFSLIELIISLSAFSILMILMFNLLSNSQEGINRISSNFDAFSESRVINDYLRKDLNAMYIGDDILYVGDDISQGPFNTSITYRRSVSAVPNSHDLDFYTFTTAYGADIVTLCRVQWFLVTVGSQNLLMRRVIAGSVGTSIPSSLPTSSTADTKIVAYGLNSFEINIYDTGDLTNPVMVPATLATKPTLILIKYSIDDPSNNFQGVEKTETTKNFSELINFN